MSQPSSLLAVLSPAEIRDFLPGPLLGEVSAIAPEFHLVDPTTLSVDEVQARLAAVEPEVVLACWKTPRLPELLPAKLRYVCYLCGSVRSLVMRSHLERGLLVSNWGGSIARTVAEGTLLLILSALRRAGYWYPAMHRDGAWKDGATRTTSLFGRRVGLHGFGRVARELVRLLAPFEVELGVCAPDLTPELAAEWRVRPVPTPEALFGWADVTVELAALTPETKGFVTEALLRCIRPGGVFVNVARGAIVDEAGLVRVAREGQLAVALDVYQSEPLAADHPLRGLPNVTLTPHLAGPTDDRRRDAGAFALHNLRAYAAGAQPDGLITPESYDAMT